MQGHDLYVVNATVWSRPSAAPETGCSVGIRAGLIESVRPGPPEAGAGVPVVDAQGRVVTAGFWNCHVHLTEPVWSGAARRPAPVLQAALDDMFLSRGFTTVVDLASNSRDTLPLRRRIESGELAGPTILTATEALYPARGLPFYLRRSVPWYLWWALPTPWTTVGAALAARHRLGRGADVIKLFTGSYVEPDRIKLMGRRQARAAVEVAHDRGALVFAHTSDREGLGVALDAGVDVVAHVPDETAGTHPLLEQAAERGVRLVPTLQMFAETVTREPAYLDPIDAALRAFVAAGGHILFGTDVGYLTVYDPAGELAALERCGLDAPAVLRSLTTEPAAAFGRADVGAVEPGMRADLTILATSSPDVVPLDLANVVGVVRAGRVVLSADGD